MSTSPAPYFFMSYSREDTAKQRRIVRELRQRGINIWVDIENLTPGTPTWEREIEKAIRGATGMIVLLSPESNNSEWVRREISFGEQHRKRIFPVLIEGDDNTSTPLRLSSHQRVDLRTKFDDGLDQLATAVKDYIGVKEDIASQSKTNIKKSLTPKPAVDLKKYGLPALIALIGLMCIGGIVATARFIANIEPPTPTEVVATPTGIDPVITITAPALVVDQTGPIGKIVFTCGINGDEVCVMNANGSDWRQLTDSQFASFNGSLSPDGKKVVFVTSGNKNSEIYEMDLASRKTEQLTELNKNLGAPEISPDNKYIIFHYRSGNNKVKIWLMNRDGSDPHEFYSSSGKDAHDPTWSPDGKQILFAMGNDGHDKFYVIDFDGHDPQLVNNSIDSRGRSDWSINNLISFDMGGSGQHDVYLMSADGSNLRQMSNGNNSQGASLSPDGMWIAFMAYTGDPIKEGGSCEIFIMRVDGSDIRQLTDNNYCDYQPRWGN